MPNKQDLDLPIKSHGQSFKNQMAKRMIQTLSSNKEEEAIKAPYLVASIKKEMDKNKAEKSS